MTIRRVGVHLSGTGKAEADAQCSGEAATNFERCGRTGLMNTAVEYLRALNLSKEDKVGSDLYFLHLADI
jgi:hypothetical protein